MRELPFRRAALLPLIVLWLLPAMLRGQAPPPMFPPLPAPAAPPVSTPYIPSVPPSGGTSYRGYRHFVDTVFQMGAHYNVTGRADLAKNTLHFDFTQVYKGPRSSRGFQRTDPLKNRQDRDDSIFYNDLKDVGLPVVYAPGILQFLANHAEVSESYFSYDPYYIHVWNHGIEGNDTNRAVDSSTANDYFFGGVYPGPHDSMLTFMKGLPRYTAEGLGKAGFNDLIGHSADNDHHDLTLALKISDSVLAGVGNNDTLVYARIFRRVILGQGSCRCKILNPTGDVVAITKAVFTDAARSRLDPSSHYRDVTTTLFFPADSTFTPSRTLRIEWHPQDSLRHVHDTLIGGIPYHVTTYTQRAADSITAFTSGVPDRYFGARNGWSDWGVASTDITTPDNPNGKGRFCKRLLDSLRKFHYIDSALAFEWDLEGGDIGYMLYTTNKVPVTFLRGRIAPRTYTNLRAGLFDSVIAQQIDTIFTDSVLKDIVTRFVVTDEPHQPRHKAYQEIGARVQREILSKDNTLHMNGDGKYGLWANPIGEHATFRVLSGDLDTGDIKMMQMMISQTYNVTGRRPVAYVNPDMMRYRIAGDTILHNSAALDPGNWYDSRDRIAYNTPHDYEEYLRRTMGHLQIKLNNMVDVADVARNRFRSRTRETYPVMATIHSMGYLNSYDWETDGKDGYITGNWRFIVPTPEEITAQCWLALNCGLNGIVFGDFSYDGNEMGVINKVTGDHAKNYYDSVNATLPDNIGPQWTLPLMWTGFHDRFEAVHRVTSAFYDTIIPVYKKLDKNGWRMTVSDSNAHFSAMPLLDTLYTVPPQRLRDGSGHYIDSAYSDPKSRTYIEATVFNPGQYDSHKSNRYLLLTNKRCWPNDDATTYSRFVDTLCRASETFRQSTGDTTMHIIDSNRYRGFGPIDVRRPIIKFKNDLHELFSEYEIQKVGWDTNTWQRVKVDSAVELDWLEPGWGAMYRIRPVGGVSNLGTAYNNAVRSENLSIDGHAKNQLAVYEHDSTIWLRVIDSLGNVSAERMISDSADTVRVPGSSPRARTANNMFPALATVRDGQAVMVVWERETGGQAMVEACYFPTRPDFGALPTRSRVRLSLPRTIASTHLTPSIVGLDTGWTAAWASPPGGVEVAAIRNSLSPSLASNISAISRIKARGVDMVPAGTWTDSLASFPSLAHVRSYYSSGGNGYAGVSMAFQQNSYSGESHIFYKFLGVRWPGSGQPLLETSMKPEDVTVGIQSCSFSHPSIAVDSFIVGVAFETAFNINRGIYTPFEPFTTGLPIVTLRFRNPFAGFLGFPWQGSSVAYFGDSTGHHRYPSLTEFPSQTLASIFSGPEGGLVWMRTVQRSLTQQLWMYHYGDSGITKLSNGAFPVMTLAPYVGATPFAATGALTRSTEVERVAGQRPLGTPSAWYYPPMLINGVGSPDTNFSHPNTAPSLAASHWTLGKSTRNSPICPRLATFIGAVSKIWYEVHAPDSVMPHHDVRLHFPPTDTIVLGKKLDTAGRLRPVLKFTKCKGWNQPVKVHINFIGGDSLLSWLNSSPYDSLMGSPGDIKAVLELIRVSDTTIRWHSGQFSARYIGAGVLDTIITVPVDTAVAFGTEIYLQLRGIPTAGLDYESSIGIQFLNDSLTDEAGVEKRAWRPENRTDATSPQSGLRITVIPNPARDQAELRVRVVSPGTATITISDMLGRVVRVLPVEEIDRAGEYSMPIDLTALGRGTYIVQARIGDDRGSARMVIMR